MSPAAVAPDGAAVARRLRRHLLRGVPADAHHLLVAVSGGRDSVVLLHALRFLLPGRWQLTAAHYDHRMRPSSGADADWVAGLCRAWGIPLARGAAVEPPRSEADARSQRYAFLEQAADDLHADLILTAHHADDQAETVLFRLLRGTGLRGLGGIPARRGRILRPLLLFTRAGLHAYARARELRWREDPSNVDEAFARNRIRHSLLPALERARPGAVQNLARIARLARRMESAHAGAVAEALHRVVESRTDDGFALARERLLAYPLQVRARVLRHLFQELGGTLGYAATRAAVAFAGAGTSGTAIDLGGGALLRREFDSLMLVRPASGHAVAEAPLRIEAAETGAGTFVTGGQKYVARWAPAPPHAGSADTVSFDPSLLRFPLELRGWIPGDRIQLAYGGKKLKKLFQERRIGRSRRARLPVLVDGDARVLWIPGVARSTVAEQAAGTGFHIMVVDDVSF